MLVSSHLTLSQSFQLYQMTYVERFMYTQRLYQKVTSCPPPRWIHRHKQTASVCLMYVVIVLLLPPCSVIGSLSQAKFLFMVSRLSQCLVVFTLFVTRGLRYHGVLHIWLHFPAFCLSLSLISSLHSASPVIIVPSCSLLDLCIYYLSVSVCVQRCC